MQEKRIDRDRLGTGWLVFIGLAVLTAVEFVIGLLLAPALPYLIITSLIKAGLIIYYFMHIGNLFHRDASHK